MAIISNHENIDHCATHGGEEFHYGSYGFTPHGGCDGESHPHSDQCGADGERDYEDFMAGEWVYHTEEPDMRLWATEWVCECIVSSVENWADIYAAHWAKENPARHQYLTGDDVRRLYALDHAEQEHREANRAARKEVTA